jgi:hypothetical protein
VSHFQFLRFLPVIARHEILVFIQCPWTTLTTNNGEVVYVDRLNSERPPMESLVFQVREMKLGHVHRTTAFCTYFNRLKAGPTNRHPLSLHHLRSSLGQAFERAVALETAGIFYFDFGQIILEMDALPFTGNTKNPRPESFAAGEALILIMRH